MIKKIYGIMKKGEQDKYARLLCLEINSNLHKIYRKMKPKAHLAPQQIRVSQLKLIHAESGATKMWEFKPPSREKAMHGDLGVIKVVTRGLDHNTVRKQRALLMAAEFYVYHSFANHKDPALYAGAVNQNQYLDVLKKSFGMKNAHETRDHAIRYVVETIGEHKLAHFSGDGWHTSISKLKKHHPDIASAVGSSEKEFKEILRKQHQKFDHNMLKQEEDLIRKEIEDLQHIIMLLEDKKKHQHGAKLKKLINIHEENLKTFQGALKRILHGLDSWILVDKKEHGELRKRAGLTASDLHKLLLAEAEAEKIDINKVHVIADYFKKEKINILWDLELTDKLSADTHRKKG